MKLLHTVRILLLFLVLAVFGACGTMPMPASVTPNERVPLVMVPICGVPTALASSFTSESDSFMWAFSETMRLVASTDTVEFSRAARHHKRFYAYDRHADPANAVTMPRGHELTPCPEPDATQALVKPSHVYLLAGKVVPVPPAPCKLLADRQALALFEPTSEDLRADAPFDTPNPIPDRRYVAQPAHTTGAVRAPKHPDPERIAQEQVLKRVTTESYLIGKKIGSTGEGIESGMAHLSSNCSRFDEDLRENSDILADYQNKIAQTLNDLPIPPVYSDPHLRGPSERAFSQGFEAGVGSKKLEFLALDTTTVAALILFPNVYVATETLAAKAIRSALERLRSIPIYVPAATNGAGFFFKLPKTPPANTNGASISAPAPPAPKALVLTPPITRAPFGNLSRAAEFGVQTEGNLARAIAGTGLQKHHLFEQRFGPKMGGDPRMNLTIAVTPAEHQEFTNRWRLEIAYGAAGTFNKKIGSTEIINAARRVYKDYPAILKALDL